MANRTSPQEFRPSEGKHANSFLLGLFIGLWKGMRHACSRYQNDFVMWPNEKSTRHAANSSVMGHAVL